MGAAVSGGVVAVGGALELPPFVTVLGSSTSFLRRGGQTATRRSSRSVQSTATTLDRTRDGRAGLCTDQPHQRCDMRKRQRGFDCRDDVTGMPTRPVFTSDDLSPISPCSDGLAGISGDTAAAVVATSATDSLSVVVMRVRATRLSRTPTSVSEPRPSMEAAATPSLWAAPTRTATLVLLRRSDLKTYPLFAIGVTRTKRTILKSARPGGELGDRISLRAYFVGEHAYRVMVGDVGRPGM